MLGLRCCEGFPLVAESGGYSQVEVRGLLIVVAFLVRNRGRALEWTGFSSCSMWAQLCLEGSRAQAQLSWCLGLVAVQQVGSAQIRDQTRVPCTGRWILHHWATREAPPSSFGVWSSATLWSSKRNLTEFLGTRYDSLSFLRCGIIFTLKWISLLSCSMTWSLISSSFLSPKSSVQSFEMGSYCFMST